MRALEHNLGIELALFDGYRVTVHAQHFPYESLDLERPGPVHAVVDDGARAIYCSQEFFDKLQAQLPTEKALA